VNESSILSELTRRDTDRIRKYRQMLDFYHGIQWAGRERYGEKRLTFNYARVFIDKVTSYLMSGMKFSVETGDNSTEAQKQARRAEAALGEVYQENNLEQLDYETEIDCAILGDACYKVLWDAGAKQVRITAPDVQGIHVWWRGDDMSRILKIAVKYTLSADEAELLYQVRTRDKTSTVVELWTGQDMELYLDDALLEKKPNPYGWLPFVIFPNLREPKEFWGISDLTQIVEPQKELNRAISQLSRILELSGNPIAVLENVEESQDIAVRPGAVWNIPEDARAYLLDLLQGGGVRLHIDYIDVLYRILHDVSESPRAAFGGVGRDLSGIAMQIELYPLWQKVKRKRLIRSVVYRQRSEMVLRLLEKYRGEQFGDYGVRVVWEPALPQDTSRLVADEQTLVQTGIHSRRRAMDELGVKDPQAEFNRWLEEREAILRMNNRFNARPVRGGASERALESRTEGVGE
jgi:hypothetical protein